MNTFDKWAFAFSIFIIAVGIATAIGWALNVIKFIALIGGEITAELVVRGVGVFVAPLGAILGWF